MTCRQPIEILAQESELDFKKLEGVDELTRLSDGIALQEISNFLYDDITSDDSNAQLSRVINYPLRLEPAKLQDGSYTPDADKFFVQEGKICLDFAEKYFQEARNGRVYPYKIVKKWDTFDISTTVDEFVGGQKVNLDSVLR